MSKEEFLKIQTCVLKVNIHCDGCKQKVKKILQKIDGVYTTKIDSEQGKVTVSGNVDPATLIKKLTKNGKHAEIWGAPKANNNNPNQMNNQLKNLQIDNGSKGGKNKGQAPKVGGNNQSKGGPPQAQNPQFQQQLQQLQQLQQMKGLQDLKIPPQFMKDLKGANVNKDQHQKSVKFNLPEDEGLSDDDFDDDDFDDDDYDFEDEVDDIPVANNKMKPPMLGSGHGGAQMDNIIMNNIMNGQHPQLMKGGGNNGVNGGGNEKRGGGGGNMPVQMNLGGGDRNQGGANGGKKGGSGKNNGGSQNQGGGKGGKNGGGQPNDGKNGGGGGNGQNKNSGVGGAGVVNGHNYMGNGAKKGGGMDDGPHCMPNMMPMSAGGKVGQMGNLPMGQMGNLPMGQMGNLAAVQGLPASSIPGGGGGGGVGYYPATVPDHMAPNPYYQQQLAAMMMNQQRANGNERFQPMMYARPPPAVNYMPPYPPYPHPYPYATPQGERTDQYTMFSDENTSSCNVM